MIKVDVAIIGGGPAGMAAAVAAHRQGAKNILLIEREPKLGGILEQCIHNGFGLHKFKEELTGPEYALRYQDIIEEEKIPFMVNTTVIDISAEKIITAVNKEKGYFQIDAKAIVLAMGCRERPRGALSIPGTRPAGVYSAGTAQKLVNIKGYLPGKKIVILGSGDIGLIMARRMTLEGAKVEAVCEIMADSGGLTRNIVQCLEDFNIPLKLRHTVTEIHGKERVEGVTVSQVDDNLKPIPGTEEYVECDTLMLSVGLIPENELSKKAGVVLDPKTKGPVVDESRQTSVEGIFACGNVVRVHELVDFVSDEGQVAGEAAAAYAKGAELPEGKQVFKNQIEQKKGVKNLSQGSEKIVICTTCPMGCKITVEETTSDDKDAAEAMGKYYRTIGNTCKRGMTYAVQEVTVPHRTLTTLVEAQDGTMVSVKTDKPIPKSMIKKVMKAINSASLILPIRRGEIIIEDVEKTGADVISTGDYCPNTFAE